MTISRKTLGAMSLAALIAACGKHEGGATNPSGQPTADPTSVAAASDRFRPYFFSRQGTCSENTVVYRFMKGDWRFKLAEGGELVATLTLVLFENGTYRGTYFEHERPGGLSRNVSRPLMGRFVNVGDRLWFEELGEAEPARSGGKPALRLRFARNPGSFNVADETILLDARSSGEPPFKDLNACATNAN